MDLVSFIQSSFSISFRKKTYFPFIHRLRKIGFYKLPTFCSENHMSYIKYSYKKFKTYGGPLNESSVCKLIGATPNYVGFVPSRRRQMNYRFARFLSNTQMSDEVRKVLLTPRHTWTGGYDSYRHVLNEFTKPSEFNYTVEQVLDILEQEDFPWLRLPKMDFPKVSELENLYVNPSAHPGFFTRAFFGETRRETLSTSIHVARAMYNHLMNKPLKYQGLWTLGGRSKDVKLSLGYTEDVSTRAVWIPEEPLVLLSLLIVQPFTRALQKISGGCIFIGKNYDFSEAPWYSKLDDLYDVSFKSDWSLYDAHVPNEVILAAVSIIRSCYPDDRHVTRFFSFLYDTIVSKNLVVPPGFVYRVDKGMPSGHPLVSLVNSIANYILWVIILRESLGKGKVSSSTYGVFHGDDSKIYAKFTKNLYKVDNVIRDKIHMPCDPVISSMCFLSRHSIDRPHVPFLKRYVDDYGISCWYAPSFIKKFIYTDKDISGLHSKMTWFFSNLVMAPGNDYLAGLFYDFFRAEIRHAYRGDKEKVDYELEQFDHRFRNTYELGLKHQMCDKSIFSVDSHVFYDNFYQGAVRVHISKVLRSSAALEFSGNSLVQGYLLFSDTAVDRGLYELRKKFNSFLYRERLKPLAKRVLPSVLERTGVSKIVKYFEINEMFLPGLEWAKGRLVDPTYTPVFEYLAALSIQEGRVKDARKVPKNWNNFLKNWSTFKFYYDSS
uniref:RNA-dependent RNA polymerase n=1 Tax=Amalga-like dominovirus TaxID=2784738 RepID=A0A7S6YL59_9VIRU|nr:RNA-dependent RNA polymerase [Amalga-like dominovirus]